MGRKSAGTLSFARSQRLRRASEIQALFQRGHRDERRSFIALWRQAEGSRRVGFMTGRRVGGAVERNRVRRRIREAYRQQQHALPQGIEVIFIGRPAALKNPFVHLLDEMKRCLVAVRTAAAQLRGGGARE